MENTHAIVVRVVVSPFRLDPVDQRLWRQEQAVPLRPKTFAVLNYLAERPGRLIGKDELLDAVWGHRHISESVLEGCISELRKALGDDAKSPRYLETMARRGYRFIAEIQASPAGSDPAPALPLPPATIPAETGSWVGREEHLQCLLGVWKAAQGGNQQLLFLSGEAGLGKTTLIEMFL